jgi:hypothetical protein
MESRTKYKEGQQPQETQLCDMNGAMLRRAAGETPATAVASKPRGQQVAGGPGRFQIYFLFFRSKQK